MYERNQGGNSQGFVVYARSIANQCIYEIATQIGKTLWIGIKNKTATANICIDFLLRTRKLQSFNVNIIRDLKEEMNGLETGILFLSLLIMGNSNCRIGERQVE